jgi:hypothetical protein
MSDQWKAVLAAVVALVIGYACGMNGHHIWISAHLENAPGVFVRADTPFKVCAEVLGIEESLPACVCRVERVR